MAHESEHRHHFKNRKEKIGWYLDEIDCYKEDMGKWYTLFIRIILPFLLFIIPINKISFRGFELIRTKYLLGVLPEPNSTIPIIIWLIGAIVFLAILIFLPRFATFCEFAMAGVFYYMALTITYIQKIDGKWVERAFITNGLGYFIVFALGTFMLMKLIFLVLEIMYMIVFHGEKEPKAYKDDQNEIVF